ncbi:PDDEXK family nuclease [Streptomyces cavernicola]|uniref:Uncharacterized protein n=1 Tax=Streptomyces cavernicola TaxID=3043613 RepID=A0ABT6SD55_9ACTN|nr:hypothetical protein [Streptomyces sp. B-S-A6]MDI3405592.1 hypothetical protein [Streptomyces sp. B-S-A6]
MSSPTATGPRPSVPVLAVVLAVAVVGGGGCALWRAHRRAVRQDRQWRAQEEARERELPMPEVDALSWQDFEKYVADLCRRDGWTGNGLGQALEGQVEVREVGWVNSTGATLSWP